MLYIGILIVVGMLGGKIAKIFKAPTVTGYLLSGILIGPAVFNIINSTNLNKLHILSELALSLIAFTIGSEFNMKNIKKLGKNIFVITIAQAGITFLLVFAVSFYLFSASFAFSILLAAISCATAPAATIMVINQYRADGPLVRTLVPVVAIDDAICIIVFGISFSISKTFLGSEALSLGHMVWEPFLEISFSLLLGAVAGILFSFSHKYFKSDEDTLIALLGIVILSAGIAIHYNLSSLLTCMMIGAMVANLLGDRKRIFHLSARFCPPIYLVFFTVAGASLHLGELSHIGLLGIAYVLARTAGKILGAALGAKLSAAPSVISRYLGLGLLPQAGVAIGLGTLVNNALPGIGPKLMTVVLGGVVFFEIIGPFSAKYAIQHAGEIGKRQMRD